MVVVIMIMIVVLMILVLMVMVLVVVSDVRSRPGKGLITSPPAPTHPNQDLGDHFHFLNNFPEVVCPLVELFPISTVFSFSFCSCSDLMIGHGW